MPHVADAHKPAAQRSYCSSISTPRLLPPAVSYRSVCTGADRSARAGPRGRTPGRARPRSVHRPRRVDPRLAIARHVADGRRAGIDIDLSAAAGAPSQPRGPNRAGGGAFWCCWSGLSGPALFPAPADAGVADGDEPFLLAHDRAVYTLEVTGPGDSGSPRAICARAGCGGGCRCGPVGRGVRRDGPVFVPDFPPPRVDGTRTTAVVATGNQFFPGAAVPLVYLAGDVAITIDRDPTGTARGPRRERSWWTHVVTA